MSSIKEAIEIASNFPKEEQNLLANHWIQEMKWAKTFHESQDALEILADKALEEIKGGKSEEMGWDHIRNTTTFGKKKTCNVQ